MEKGFRLSFLALFLWELDIQIDRGCGEKANSREMNRFLFVKINCLLADDAWHLKDFQFLFNFKYEKVTFSVQELNTASNKFSIFDPLAALQQMQLRQCKNWSSSRWMRNVSSSSSDVKMSVLDWFGRRGVVFVQSRRHDQKSGRCLVASWL